MKKKTFKYYLMTYIMVFVFLIILEVISHSKGDYLISSALEIKEGSIWASEFSIFIYKNVSFVVGKYVVDILCALIFPALMAFVFWLIDFVMDKIKSKPKKDDPKMDEKYYEDFVDEIGSKLNKTHKFNVEDFRHFRENTKVQECLKKLYQIYKSGETEENNYRLVLRKFDKGTQEREAIEYLIAFTETKRKEKETKEKEEATEAANKETKETTK